MKRVYHKKVKYKEEVEAKCLEENSPSEISKPFRLNVVRTLVAVRDRE